MPTFSQIRAQVAAIRRHAPHDRIFGIQTAGRWSGELIRTVAGESYCLVQCDSPLAMRAALQEDVPAGTAKVLLTNLPDEQISYDIRVRVARRKFYPINNWQIVKELFQAHYIDPRVADRAWIAERLLETVPPDGYPPVPSGVLDAETVWGVLLERQLGLGNARPDLVSLLTWSMDPDHVQRYHDAADTFRQATKDWITQFAGPATDAVLECVQANAQPNALPIGLALAVVFSKDAAGKLDKAAGRMEKYVGPARLNEHVAQRWQAAATEVVRLHIPDLKARAAWLQRADEILQAVQADAYAHLSRTSPLGFDQRLARFGKALVDTLESTQTGIPEPFRLAYRAVLEHDQSHRGSRRVQRVEMAARLCRWLVGLRRNGIPSPASFADAAGEHALTGGFVDWARQTLRGGEPVRELADAYSRLLAKAAQVVEQQNRRFAQLLRDWTAAGSKGDAVLPIERVLDEVVAPLAAQAPVLVLVLDGMSYAVFRELLEDITRQDWTEIRRQDRGSIWPGIAAMPSLTEVCRASLLCGRLRPGQAADEKAGFAEHPGLLHQSRTGMPPVLFHKDALQESGDASLADRVIKEIDSSRRRIVGVVINAVDDHLLKGEQIDTRWTRDEIKVLPALLHEARIARRLVVLVSDHGHVLDCQAAGRLQPVEQSGERWRTAGGAPAEDELQIEGSRVLTQGHRLIAPWSERVRYGIKKNGYHGGLTPQEMVIPITVLSSTDDFPKGWSEQPIDTPAWWDEPSPEPVAGVQPAPRLKPFKPQPSGTLFDMETEDKTPVVPDVAAPTWVSRLLSCPVFEDQKRLGGRGVPSDEVFTKLLSALDQRGGKMTSVALARALEFPAVRFPGLLAKAERILNVDGYDVLRRDDASDTIELNRDLLLKQFDLAE